ncbi:Uncharacterised protein [Serratia fonticola]|uniref:Uncharacterized protein n=1 Tax=Serratia fonticola TaxID=47917 RepID=A0A0F7HEA1_SERFO|nr:hypothetical protein WN53_21345 [Serratia fonticola]CAI1585836.1 Uncharacterised protein [Serratia fonticola]CAI1756245.1 Uncharacterised protein [Serratia fonticola]CAI2490058.1 Uncharacterised protein [Serratia fonticola]VTR50744.1 Uncharacterised protein [Serratia fonticola]
MIFKQEAFSDNNAPLKFKFRLKKSHYQANITFGRPELRETQPSFPLRYSFFNQYSLRHSRPVCYSATVLEPRFSSRIGQTMKNTVIRLKYQTYPC